MTGPERAYGDRPLVPCAPGPRDARRPLVCSICGQLIAPDRLVFLLRDRSLVCGLCVSEPELQKHRTIAPLVGQVVAYGRREAIAVLLAEQAAHTQHTQPTSLLVSGLSPDRQTGAPGVARG